MTTKKFALATIAGGITFFILGGIFYGWLLLDFFANNPGTATGVMKETPIWAYLGFGELVSAALLTMVIGKWAGVSGAGQGCRIGATFALLPSVAVGLTSLGISNITTPIAPVVDVIVSVIRCGTAGSVIGMVLGKA